MSNTYLTGEQTKRKIFKESKKLFYKNGFTETTYDDISNAAKVNRALIPYHFKSKQVLGQEVYCKIIEEFQNEIDSILDISQFTPDFTSILHAVSYYRLLENNARFSRFVFQLLSDETTPIFTRDNEKELLVNLGSRFSRFSDTELDILAQMNIGIKKELIRMLCLSEKGINADQIACMHIHMLMNHAGYSARKTDELIQAAFEVANLLSFHVKSGFTIEIKYN